MDPDDMRDDESDIPEENHVPEEVEQGLAFAYGENEPENLARPARDPQPAPSVLERIGAITGHKPLVSLRDADPAGRTPMLEPLVGREHQQNDTGKYKVLGLLGRGGVGLVHRGHDVDLGRDVAMKFLHEDLADDSGILHRFVEEAQIGGQLQHPGIVPVYELGMADGKPFFTMKLVKGKTLAQLLSERESPSVDRRRILVIFEQVCQTMAYAHARGVVHRDLKPANVMIGAFGEVQVVDWGMGKVLERGGVADEKRAAGKRQQLSVIETVRSSGHGTQSVLGSVMGTPAYMPPEQAQGDIDRMDERSDVFALGAILCEILTGEPPYVGEQDELLGMAALAKLDDAHARLARCGADPELIELAERCLLTAPAARPKSAEVLARYIHDHLAGAEARAHEARVDAAEERIRASTARTRQRLAFGLVGVVALGLATSLFFFWDADTQRGLYEKSAKVALDAQEAAETNLANFNRLSHVVWLETARAKQKTFHPAWPDKAQAMRDWLDRDAKRLIDVLPELKGRLAALEARAVQQTDVEKAEERRTHPRAAELAHLRTQLGVLQRAHAVRSSQARPEPPTLDETVLPKSSSSLNMIAWPFIDPARKTFGYESRGLALARRAVAAMEATGRKSPFILDTLAWACVANGLDEEAEQRSQEALACAGKTWRARFERNAKKVESALAAARAGTDVSALETRIAALDAEVSARRHWRFPDDDDAFLHHALHGLVADIERFEETEVPAVAAQLHWAEHVEELTIGRHKDLWEEARLAIRRADGVTASKRYAASRLDLSPQMGLVPIGMNPKTLLWEFYHLRSGWNPRGQSNLSELPIPVHDADGRVDVLGRGMVFVLIPGGKSFMGAQSSDPDGPNYDQWDNHVFVVHEVDLAPYFLSKYETTRGQWARLSGAEYEGRLRHGTTTYGNPVAVGSTHPANTRTWKACDELLTAYGLVLPTEAQWECGCRGGTTTPWFTGSTRASLEKFANVRDDNRGAMDPVWPKGEAFDDGFFGSAPVGTYGANPFGLHDTHGNVAEWCRDWWGAQALSPRGGDGLRDHGPDSVSRTIRGGTSGASAPRTRSATHSWDVPWSPKAGVRPARVIR